MPASCANRSWWWIRVTRRKASKALKSSTAEILMSGENIVDRLERRIPPLGLSSGFLQEIALSQQRITSRTRCDIRLIPETMLQEVRSLSTHLLTGKEISKVGVTAR